MADATAWLTATIHATASDWSTRVQANGGAAPSANTLAAVSNFCGALDAAAISIKMMLVNVFAPDNLIASITPLFKVYGNDPWTNANFVAADLTVHGLKGNGTSKSLDTGAIPNTVFSGSALQGGMSLYNTFPDVGVGADIYVNNVNDSFILYCCNAGNATALIWSIGNGQASATGLPLGLGFTSSSRLSATSMNIYTANSTVAFSSIASIATTLGVPAHTYSIYIFAKNISGTINSWTSKRFSFAAIHSGLTLAETQSLYNAVQQMRQAFGGGWI